jgi:hypothetical protein
MPLVTSKNKAEHDRKHMEKQSGKSSNHPEEQELSHAARELVLHGDNTEHLHRSSYVPIVANLRKRVKKGQYDEEKARKLWGYHADRAAHSYHKEFGDATQPWHKMFPTEDRRQAAHHWESINRDSLYDPDEE